MCLAEVLKLNLKFGYNIKTIPTESHFATKGGAVRIAILKSKYPEIAQKLGLVISR